MTTDTFKRAEQFIWKNARLLERRLFAYHFKGGSRDSVVTALLAYQNSDGGFGQALEPDICGPNSQPVLVQYVRKPLDWAPLPNHPLRRYFSQTMIEANLDAIIAAQEADGGWGVPWKTLSPACELEWRGWITVDRLQILRANGRI